MPNRESCEVFFGDGKKVDVDYEVRPCHEILGFYVSILNGGSHFTQIMSKL